LDHSQQQIHQRPSVATPAVTMERALRGDPERRRSLRAETIDDRQKPAGVSATSPIPRFAPRNGGRRQAYN